MKNKEIISQKFLNLEHEKKERILNAAINEFAKKGFKNASTNEIVLKSNISKGLLFHYFKNKKYLFLFLYEYCMNILMKELFSQIGTIETDLLLRLRKMTLLKLKLIKKYPELLNFVIAANKEESSMVKKELDSENKTMIADSYKKMLDGIDTSKFKKDIDIKRTIHIIFWTLEGFSLQEREKRKSLALNEINTHTFSSEMDEYLSILKTCFYK